MKCIREMPVHQLLSSQLISTVETLHLFFAFQAHASGISCLHVTSLITQAACNQSYYFHCVGACMNNSLEVPGWAYWVLVYSL